MVASLPSELRLSARRLTKRPGSTLLAVAMLSVGIGVTSVFYLVVRGGMTGLPPVPGVEQIARVWLVDPHARDERVPPSPAEWVAWQQARIPGLMLAVVVPADRRAVIDGRSVEISVHYVSDSYFDVVGVRLERGRPFAAGDPPAILVSHHWWTRLPASTAGNASSAVQIDGDSYTVAGVMPGSFWFPGRGTPDAILPWSAAPKGLPAQVFGRLAPGVTPAGAGSTLSGAIAALRTSGWTVRVVPLAADVRSRRRLGSAVLLGPSLLVLLSVCANVGALLLGGTLTREKELAIRASLGARGGQLARESLVEAMLLAVSGGLLAMLSAAWAIAWLERSALATNPAFREGLPSWTEAWPMAIAAVALATLGSAIAPSLHAARLDVVRGISGRLHGKPRRRGQYGLADLVLILQVAVATGTVVWAAMVSELVRKVGRLPPEAAVERVWLADAVVKREKTGESDRTLSILLERAGAWPGVEAAALTDTIPFDGPRGASVSWRAETEGGARLTCAAALVHVSPSYFRIVGATPRGRLPVEPGEALLNPLAFDRCGSPRVVRPLARGSIPLTILGTVDEQVVDGPVFPQRPVAYAPISLVESRQATLLIRRAPGRDFNPRAFAEGLRRELPGVSLSDPAVLASRLHDSMTGARTAASIFGILSALALLLAICGVYAALGQAVDSRLREIAIMLALGAPTRQVLRATVGRHLFTAVIGVVLGGAAALVAIRMLAASLASTAATPELGIALLALLLTCTVASAAVPVLRVVRVAPADVLRQAT